MVSSRCRVLGDPISTTSSGAPRRCSGGHDLRRAFVRQIDQVRFDDVELGEHDVVGRGEQATDGMVFQPGSHEKHQLHRHLLVFRVRRRGHVVLPVNELVPLPVVGEEDEVVVGELHARRSRRVGHGAHCTDGKRGTYPGATLEFPENWRGASVTLKNLRANSRAAVAESATSCLTTFAHSFCRRSSCLRLCCLGTGAAGTRCARSGPWRGRWSRADRREDPHAEAEPLHGDGGGANTLIRVTPDGLIVVDTKNPGDENFNRLMEEIRSVSTLPVKYVINTQHHPDHVGTNQKFIDAGATVVASEALKTWMASDPRTKEIPGLPRRRRSPRTTR